MGFMVVKRRDRKVVGQERERPRMMSGEINNLLGNKHERGRKALVKDMEGLGLGIERGECCKVEGNMKDKAGMKERFRSVRQDQRLKGKKDSPVILEANEVESDFVKVKVPVMFASMDIREKYRNT